MATRVASYAFYKTKADNFIGPIDWKEDEYRTDWGYAMPMVKARARVPSFLTDNEMVDLLLKAGAQVLSIDGRRANENNVLEKDEDAAFAPKAQTSATLAEVFTPRRVTFEMINGESLSIVVKRREGAAYIAAALKQDLESKSGMRVTGIRLNGERWTDALSAWASQLQAKFPKLSAGKRWTGVQDKNQQIRNAQYVFAYRYAADLAPDGKQGTRIQLRSKVASKTDNSGKVLRPDIVNEKDWNRLIKVSGDDATQAAGRACKTINQLTPRHIVATFVIGDEGETIVENATGRARFETGTMMIPVSDYKSQFLAGFSPPGTATLGGALKQFAESNKHLVCCAYYGESNRQFGEWIQTSTIQDLLNFLN